jgi:hypothetical protein
VPKYTRFPITTSHGFTITWRTKAEGLQALDRDAAFDASVDACLVTQPNVVYTLCAVWSLPKPQQR